MIKKLDTRFVDMAIYIDKHILDKNSNVSLIYDYLVHLAYMLIIKHKLFVELQYSELYAYYLANIVYLRMTTPRLFLSQDDPKYLTPIKSCLNYMKVVLYPRKCAFANEEFGYTTKEGDLTLFNALKLFTVLPIKRSAASMCKVEIESYMMDIPKVIHKIILQSPYRNDLVISHNLYNSVILSLLRNLKLSKKLLIRLNKHNKPGKISKLDAVALSLYESNNLMAPIAYNLNADDFETLISVFLLRVKRYIMLDMNDISSSYDYSDEMIEDIIMSNLVDSTNIEELI